MTIPDYPATVTYAGEVMSLPDAATVERYAVAMYGADHDALDRDSLVSIAGQAAHDAALGQDPYGVR